ncbi:MAG: prolyl oligopeptidase family serine peptidase [Cyclobacteriaceae bacterium]|nr:prolyl oligopeptidase family serine peptidase [Cyclobacteriaceae bacterium]
MRTLFILFIAFSFTAIGQKGKAPVPPSKKPLTHDVYDNWKEISFRALTPDGTFAVYTLNPQDGDGKVVFHNLSTQTQDSVKRASDIAITWDGRHAVFKIRPQKKLVAELRRQKKKKEDLPKDSLGIYSFSTRKTEKVPDVRSFKIPQKAGGWLAYQTEPPKESKSAPAKPDSARNAEKPRPVKKQNDENGYTLVLRNLNTGSETRFDFVKDYLFDKQGNCLLFHTTGNEPTTKPGVYRYDLATLQLQLLHEAHRKHKIKGLSLTDDGQQVAFLVDADTTKALIRHYSLYHWKTGEPAAAIRATDKTPGVPPGWLISEHATPAFSKDGTRLFLGIAPEPVVQDTTLLPEEIVNVEVWTWKDDYIYPQQNRRLEEDRKRSYQAVIHLNTNRLVQLAGVDMPTIEAGNEGNGPVALSANETPYLVMRTWDTDVYKDLTLINLADGSREIIQRKVKGNARLSPEAKYVLWYSNPDTSWFCYSVAGKTLVKLNEGLRVSFGDEEDDHPYYPSSYGLAGFTTNDEAVLVYDRYDIWMFDPENKKAPVNLTQIGRSEKIRFRYVRLDPEERAIDTSQDIYLTAFNEVTRQSGFYRYSFKERKLTRLMWGDYRVASLSKARKAGRFLFTRETFQEFPDLWVSDASFTAPRKITNANPQMSRYRWGSVEIVKWTSADNIPLEGLLYKPEDFDPKKKYPMLVYFYERNSENLHQHYAPAPIRSAINYTMYVSNGYLVFVPDVVYRIGYPGESAMNCIMPGITALLAKGFVDEQRIGIQGHSWGGYQVAYMITQTTLFRAAEAGAPVVNMISAYGGVRWESGLSRMFQYEQSQSRIGGTLWEKPMQYIENSPIFFADKVQTPLLMMHNDADGAVPWYQGIEYYMALRRLGKPAWMLNYNNQGHGLTQRQDRIDFAKRMMQFFDHYLKDAPMPEWMKRGVPAVEKGIRQGIN